MNSVNQHQILKFYNRSEKEIKLILEPWPEIYKVSSGKSIEIVPDGIANSEIEFEYDGQNIVVYGWADSINVLCDGEKLEPDFE